ncbi:MAG: 50S ribosomal protein L11 methyltransferase [Bacillota bacterium]|jgi:ribosomal protein L11 methyltransferase
MRYLELRAQMDRVLVEAATAVLLEMVQGVAWEEGSSWTVVAHFPDTQEGKRRLEEASRVLKNLPAFFHMVKAPRLSVGTRDEEEWAEAWKKYYKPLRVGPFYVVPAWERPEITGDDLVLRLDPGMAFGTGTHVTTQLAMEAIAREVTPGMRVLDVGTGSGILALAAALKGASQVWGIDRDPVAVRSGRANARLNGLSGRVRITRGELVQWARPDRPPLDVVVANITGGVIRSITPLLARILKPGGTFIASGIVDTQEEDTVKTLSQNGFALSTRRRDGWVLITSRR